MLLEQQLVVVVEKLFDDLFGARAFAFGANAFVLGAVDLAAMAASCLSVLTRNRSFQSCFF